MQGAILKTSHSHQHILSIFVEVQEQQVALDKNIKHKTCQTKNTF